MLENTFCHIPGVGEKAERSLWASGIHSWSAVAKAPGTALTPRKRDKLLLHAAESAEALAAGNAGYFDERLPSSQAWRMFPPFAGQTAYLDIETTGLDAGDVITTIALYDGQAVHHFVRNQNMDHFADHIAQYKLLVTFNGKSFDIPFLRRHLGIPLPHAHIDLRYVLASLGMSGGLKACERQLGLNRHDLAEVDGFFAVQLWHDYQRTCNPKTLETLLAYNVADVIHLAVIMPWAYNRKLETTPFHGSHQMPLIATPANPFSADPATLRRIRASMSSW